MTLRQWVTSKPRARRKRDEHVERGVRARVTRVSEVVGRETADVQLHLAGDVGDEVFDLLRERVVEANGHFPRGYSAFGARPPCYQIAVQDAAHDRTPCSRCWRARDRPCRRLRWCVRPRRSTGQRLSRGADRLPAPAPSPRGWRSVQVSHASLAYRDDAHGASVLLNARCHRPDEGTPLRRAHEPSPHRLDRARGREPGDRAVRRPRGAPHEAAARSGTACRCAFDIYVLKKDGCVYDFVYIGRPDAFDGGAPRLRVVRARLPHASRLRQVVRDARMTPMSRHEAQRGRTPSAAVERGFSLPPPPPEPSLLDFYRARTRPLRRAPR